MLSLEERKFILTLKREELAEILTEIGSVPGGNNIVTKRRLMDIARNANEEQSKIILKMKSIILNRQMVFDSWIDAFSIEESRELMELFQVNQTDYEEQNKTLLKQYFKESSTIHTKQWFEYASDYCKIMNIPIKVGKETLFINHENDFGRVRDIVEIKPVDSVIMNSGKLEIVEDAPNARSSDTSVILEGEICDEYDTDEYVTNSQQGTGCCSVVSIALECSIETKRYVEENVECRNADFVAALRSCLIADYRVGQDAADCAARMRNIYEPVKELYNEFPKCVENRMKKNWKSVRKKLRKAVPTPFV